MTEEKTDHKDDKTPAVADDEKVNVPKSALLGVKEELKKTKSERDNAIEQLELYKANPPTAHAPQAAPAPQQGIDALEDDDLVSVADWKQKEAQLRGEFQARLNEIQLATKDKDYVDTLKTYLPKVLERNPALRQAISTSSNPHELAYELAKAEKGTSKESDNKDKDAMAELDALLAGNDAPTSPSAAGGGGGIDKADLWKSLSDEDFEKEFQKIMNK
jgi:hypothetical protein